jgi:hypothetical protein
MSYSKAYLSTFNESENFGNEDHQAVTQDLVNKLTRGESLSLAEEEYICTVLNISHADNSEGAINPFDYEECENYWFRYRYLIYYGDLEGYGKIYDRDGEVGVEQKRKDIAFLEGEFQIWNNIISTNPPVGLIDYVARETKHQIKVIEKYCKNALIGYFRELYLIKSIVLHGRSVFFLVKEFYEELGTNDEKINLFNQIVLIDAYCFVHILFRHYSALIKEHQMTKTYHYDENIDFRTIPSFLKFVIEIFGRTISAISFNQRTITFVYNGKPYAIWFRPFKISYAGNNVVNYLRLQTFYPIELASDLWKISKMNKIKVDESLSFLI